MFIARCSVARKLLSAKVTTYLLHMVNEDNVVPASVSNLSVNSTADVAWLVLHLTTLAQSLLLYNIQALIWFLTNIPAKHQTGSLYVVSSNTAGVS